MRKITLNIYQRGDRVYYLRYGQGKQPWSMVTASVAHAQIDVTGSGITWRYDLNTPERINEVSYNDIFQNVSEAHLEVDRRNGKRQKEKV